MSEELTKTKLLPIQGKDMDSIMQNLETGVAELFTSERYQEYLKTMSKFHNYSFNNTLLIAMQRPDATLVTGYRNCQSMGRQVKKGEKGITIIAPAPIKRKKEQAVLDQDQKPVIGPDGKPKTEEVEVTLPCFKAITVFDIEQTTGEPIQTLAPEILTAAVEDFDLFLEAIREISPVPIRFDAIEGSANGYYHNLDKEIVIKKEMSQSQTLKTAIHETAHARLHDKEIMESLPLFSLTAQKVRFTGAGRLMQRPQEIYAQLFERQGLRFEQNEQGITIFGRLCPGTFTLPGNVSSQFISGLLFATPLMEAPSTIEVRAPFESRSYVDLTTDAMQKFGVKVSVRARKDGSATYKVAAPQHYAAADMDVEGDYSQAAFLAVLGSTVGGITITGLPSGSHQGDRVILDILKQCGAKFERSGSHVTFHRSLLKAVEIDLADCPDLGPVLIALGCFCSGTTIIRNAGRLRIKECDRIAAMQEELAKMGGTVKADGDTLTIEGCALHKPTAPLNGHNDHRIVMAMAVAALAAGQPAVIEGANAVNKSWPDFFEVIKGLGAHVTNQG